MSQDLLFGSEKPSIAPPTVNDLKEFKFQTELLNPLLDLSSDFLPVELRRTWPAKSGGTLRVLFALTHDLLPDALPYQLLQNIFPRDLLQRMSVYDENELEQMPVDIRGSRGYSVADLKWGSVGGKEFHRIRQEFQVAVSGIIYVQCEDVYGRRKGFVLDSGDSGRGIYIPQFMLHTYETLKDGEILVVANTLFNPDDRRTHDTYPLERFRELQGRYRS